MKIENSPFFIRRIAASLWIIPAIFLLYLLQNREELFFLCPIYLSILLCNYFVAPEKLPEKNFPAFTAFFPFICSIYFCISHLQIHFQMPSFSDIALFLFLFIPVTFACFIFLSWFLGPFALIPVLLVSSIFVFLADLFYTLFKKINQLSRILSFSLVALLLVGSLSTFSIIQPHISPLPAIVPVSEEEITVYISSSGECYHSNSHCSGMQSPRAVSLQQAKEKGRRACSKCYRKKY